MYLKGMGCEQSSARAVEWWTKAALQGQADSQFNLGVMYHKGMGCEQSYERALEWLTKAAEQGHARAQHELGDAHRALPQ